VVAAQMPADKASVYVAGVASAFPVERRPALGLDPAVVLVKSSGALALPPGAGDNALPPGETDESSGITDLQQGPVPEVDFHVQNGYHGTTRYGWVGAWAGVSTAGPSGEQGGPGVIVAGPSPTWRGYAQGLARVPAPRTAHSWLRIVAVDHAVLTLVDADGHRFRFDLNGLAFA
jgi:hypothetical protein